MSNDVVHPGWGTWLLSEALAVQVPRIFVWRVKAGGCWKYCGIINIG